MFDENTLDGMIYPYIQEFFNFYNAWISGLLSEPEVVAEIFEMLAANMIATAQGIRNA